MDRPRPPRRRPEAPEAPTTITECARRYHAAAAALAKSLGLPLTADFLQAYHSAISCVYIEAGRAGVRPASSVPLPPLPAPPVEPTGHQTTVEESITASGNAFGEPAATTPEPEGEIYCGMPDAPPAEPTTNGHAPPTVVPKGFPSAGVRVADLKPAVLRMLIAKTAALAHEEGEAWVPLLGSLQAERARRLDQGRKPRGEG
jgi:hypothetical protein